MYKSCSFAQNIIKFLLKVYDSERIVQYYRVTAEEVSSLSMSAFVRIINHKCQSK